MTGLALVLVLLGGGTPGSSWKDRRDHTLSLDEARAWALARNYSIATGRESLSSAAEGIRQAEGAYDFTFNLGGSFVSQTNPANSLLSGAPAGMVAPNQKILDFTTSLSRLLPTGGTLVLQGAGGRGTTDSTFTLLSPNYTTSLGLFLTQPLFRDRAIDSTRRAIRVTRTERDRSLASLKRTVAQTVAAVETAYWNLEADQQRVRVREQAIALAAEQLEETRQRISVGKLPLTDEAQPRAEWERRKNDLFAAQEQALRAENDLKQLILDEGADPLWQERFVPADPVQTTTATVVDLASALARAAELRPEVEEARASVARQAIEIAAARNGLKPRLDLTASYTRNGLAGAQNPNTGALATIFPVMVPEALSGDLGRSWGTIGDNLFPDARVGLSLTVPIGNRAARAGLAVAQVGERQAAIGLAQTRQGVQVEVRNAAATLETTAQRIEATRAGREAAEIQLQAEVERFKVGRSTNFLVLTRQN
ncbi:MAG TPA: TolC family protein, partial [Vicinamibacteria bacterium]|nr:TolC family protein [Vicinamibacteria bacterium]